MKLVCSLLIALWVGTGVAGAEPLTVTVKPSTATWKPKVAVAVALEVTNTARTRQVFEVMGCSWDEHWRSSDSELAWESSGCDKNAPTTVELAPGASRSWTLYMRATAKAARGRHDLTMTFRPIRHAAIASAPVTITVAN